MSALEKFCDEVRQLMADDGASAREQVRVALEKLLADEAFLAEYVGPESPAGMVQIHQDEQADFCVLAYNMGPERTSPPHDHGSSWAVYGQTEKYTDMTIWEAAEGGIKKVREFRLNPGQAGLFDTREIHSIQYPAGARFVRVTGVDMSIEARRVYNAETGEVREVSSVGAGKG